ncbi:hypothetical protein ACFWBV_23110 [Streptomyces sp. NPDC060030]
MFARAPHLDGYDDHGHGRASVPLAARHHGLRLVTVTAEDLDRLP